MSTFDELVLEVYPPEHFEYDPATDLDAYRGEFRVFPCVKGLA